VNLAALLCVRCVFSAATYTKETDSGRRKQLIVMHPVLFCFLQIDYPEVQGGRGVGGRGSVTSGNMDRSNVNLVFEDTVIINV
jgi:hypothetical protein